MRAQGRNSRVMVSFCLGGGGQGQSTGQRKLVGLKPHARAEQAR